MSTLWEVAQQPDEEAPRRVPPVPAGSRVSGLTQPPHLYFVHELGGGDDVPAVLGLASRKTWHHLPQLPRSLGSEALTASWQPLLSQDGGELRGRWESSVISFWRKKGQGSTVVKF